MRIKALIFLGILLCIFSGCYINQIPGNQNSYGLVNLQIEKNFSQTVLDPALLDTIIQHFDIRFSGPGRTIIESITGNKKQLSVLLEAGDWTVEVSGKNTEGAEIASDVQTITITPDRTVEIYSRLSPSLEGGFLLLDITWSNGSLGEPVVKASLAGSDGSVFQLPEIRVDSSGYLSTATYRGIAPAGYYTLAVQLLDGDAKVWGRVEFVHILNNKITSVLHSLKVDKDNHVVDGVQLSVGPELPFNITLIGVREILLEGDVMTVAANIADADSYQWFINGIPQVDQTGPHITIGSELKAGSYWLDLVVNQGVTTGSIGTYFTVAE